MIKILELLLNSDTLKLHFLSYNTFVKIMALCGPSSFSVSCLSGSLAFRGISIYLSTDQEVGGSNPSGYAILNY